MEDQEEDRVAEGGVEDQEEDRVEEGGVQEAGAGHQLGASPQRGGLGRSQQGGEAEGRGEIGRAHV